MELHEIVDALNEYINDSKTPDFGIALFGWWDTDYLRFVDTVTAEKLLEVKITEPDSKNSRVNLMPLYRKI